MFVNDPDLRFAQERLETFRREAEFSRIRCQRVSLWRQVGAAVRERFSLAGGAGDMPLCTALECAP